MSNDVYVRTTSAEHHACCQRIFQKSQEAGDIYLGSYEGWYNVREETFVTETEAAGTEYKDPVSGTPLEKMLESSFFFRQSKHVARRVHHASLLTLCTPGTRTGWSRFCWQTQTSSDQRRNATPSSPDCSASRCLTSPFRAPPSPGESQCRRTPSMSCALLRQFLLQRC